MKIQIAKNRMLDSVWTIIYSLNNDIATIHCFSRDVNYGYECEDSIDKGVIIEDDKRNMIELSILTLNGNEHRFEIGNQENIFSRSNKQNYESWNRLLGDLDVFAELTTNLD